MTEQRGLLGLCSIARVYVGEWISRSKDRLKVKAVEEKDKPSTRKKDSDRSLRRIKSSDAIVEAKPTSRHDEYEIA